MALWVNSAATGFFPSQVLSKRLTLWPARPVLTAHCADGPPPTLPYGLVVSRCAAFSRVRARATSVMSSLGDWSYREGR